MSKIYYIGGSPCCGKSTIAEMISQKYDFNYYRVDDDLFDFIDRGAKDGDELLSRISAMSADELWLREPIVLHKEELTVYDKLFPYFASKIKKYDKSKPLIVEGNALLPELMKKLDVNKSYYVYITPTKGFQIEHYQKREWVNDYLADSSDKLQAFANWMDRDALFAEAVREQGRNLEYTGFIVDGTISISQMFNIIVKALGIDDLNHLEEHK